MPITITFPPFQSSVGPGQAVLLQTDFIGPFPSDAQWHLEINLQPDGQDPVLIYSRPCTGNLTQLNIQADENWTEVQGGWRANNTQPVQIEARITTSSGTIESGHASSTWDSTLGLGYQIRALAQTGGQVQGGFTDSDRALLTTTEQRTSLLGEAGQLVVKTASGLLQTTLANLFSRNSLDQLVLEEMTSGPTCAPVRIVLAPIAQFAIIVRVTTVPDNIIFKTPDGEWSFPDLAVLRIFRGEDLTYRRGIHEVTFETDAPWAWGTNVLDKNLLGVPPPQTQVMVDWRTGCCGQVFIRHMP